MEFYGYTLHKDGTATLDLMVEVASGKGVAGSRWAVKEVAMTGPRRQIEAECERRNRQLAHS